MTGEDIRDHENRACDPCDDPVRPEEPYELRLHVYRCEGVVQRGGDGVLELRERGYD